MEKKKKKRIEANNRSSLLYFYIAKYCSMLHTYLLYCFPIAFIHEAITIKATVFKSVLLNMYTDRERIKEGEIYITTKETKESNVKIFSNYSNSTGGEVVSLCAWLLYYPIISVYLNANINSTAYRSI